MGADFESDLAALKSALQTARDGLMVVVGSLADADLERSLPGGWTVRRVLEHLVDAEWMYTAATAFLNGKPAPERTAASISRAADAGPELEARRSALMNALEGIEPERFYAIRKVGHEEYSPLSILENVANHDREHAEQIRKIVGGGA